MAKPEAVFIYIGTYPSKAAAEADYDVVKDLHAVGAVGSYDAAVVTKDDNGKVHEHKAEEATRHGGWGGAAVGALIGCIFPPAIIATTAPGAAIGAVSGHLWRGLPVVVGQNTIEQAMDKAGLKAEKQVAKQLDVNPKDIDQAIADGAGEVS